MAVIAPQTDVYLLKVPLEIDNTNQLTFANATAQFNYFNSLPKLPFDNFTYQRKDGVIRIPALIDDILQYNYVMYRNEGFSNKWFYAYIDKMEYLNDGVTAVSITTDVWQTWQFDLNFKTTFVEREHVNDDTIGSHTIPEGLECGEYVINSSTTLMPDKTVKDHDNHVISWTYPIVFQVTGITNVLSEAANYYNGEVNGIFSGLYYFGVTSLADARLVVQTYNADQNGNKIEAIFLAPKEFFDGAHKISGGGIDIYVPVNSSTLSTLLDTTTVSRPTKVNGYTPKNNKLFTYPFSYMYVTNNAGGNTEFRFEDFKSATPKFYMAGALGQGCSTKLCPVSYKGYTDNAEVFEYGMTGAKYPVCAWATDYYTSWITQNATNVSLGLASGIIGTSANFLSGNVTGTVNSMLGGIGGVMAQMQSAKAHPDQANGNTNCSDVLIGWQRYFTVDCMSVRYEIAETIDKFFSMFGYKVNTVKVPNITGRRNWNYVKTIGCYIEADIPQDDLQAIKDMFNNGVTFWHNANTFADYTQNNDII